MLVSGQAQRGGQRLHRVQVRALALAALEGANGVRRQPGLFGQRFLREARALPIVS
jgi:hypothetical protein